MKNDIPCRVMADLRKEEARNDLAEGAALEAEPQFLHIMKNLDSDVIDAALQQITLEEYRHLCEDLAPGTRDLAHAGSIFSDVLERHCWELAMSDAGY